MPAAWVHDVPGIAQALASGRQVRIVGPQDLLDGLRTGAYTLTKDSTGFSGIVRGVDGKIVGHLRFERVGWVAASAAAVFQVASAVTLQYYLYAIEGRLRAILDEVQDLRRFLELRADAELDGAAGLIEDAVAGLAHGDDPRGLIAAQLAQARSLVEIGYAHGKGIADEAADGLARAQTSLAAAKERSKVGGYLQTREAKQELDCATERLERAAPAMYRMLRAGELRARLDVVEAFVGTDANRELLRCIQTWKGSANAIEGTLGRLAVLEPSKEELPQYWTTVTELQTLAAPLVETLRGAGQLSVSALDVVQGRKGLAVVPVELHDAG